MGTFLLPPSNLTFFKYTLAFNPLNVSDFYDQRTVVWDRNKEEVGIYVGRSPVPSGAPL